MPKRRKLRDLFNEYERTQMRNQIISTLVEEHNASKRNLRRMSTSELITLEKRLKKLKEEES